MTTLLYTHDDFGAHETPAGHPERAGRYDAVVTALGHPDFAMLERCTAGLAEPSDIIRAHPASHWQYVEASAPDEGMHPLDPDTWVGPHSAEAARRAAGAGIEAAQKIMAGDVANAFIAARPPGHHAESDKAMGFCLINAAAITALYAQGALGCSRVAVVDFDVHHGNGTQEIFWGRENVFFASSHEWPQYPGTGLEDERGAYDQIHNQRLEPGTGSIAFRRAWGDRLLPALSDFDPDFIVISAGFDGHGADPLGGLELDEEDFAWVTREIMGVASSTCAGHIISFMEGGYDLAALGNSVAAHVKELASIGELR